jgi:hypothetical protein
MVTKPRTEEEGIYNPDIQNGPVIEETEPVATATEQESPVMRQAPGEQLQKVALNDIFTARPVVQKPAATATENIIPTPQPKQWTYRDMLDEAKKNYATERDRNYDTAMMQARGRVLQNIFKPVAWATSAFANGNGPVSLATSDVDDNGTKQGYIDAFKRAQSYAEKLADLDKEGRGYRLNQANFEREMQAKRELAQMQQQNQMAMLEKRNGYERDLLDYKAKIHEAALKAEGEQKERLIRLENELKTELENLKSSNDIKLKQTASGGTTSTQVFQYDDSKLIEQMRGLGYSDREIADMIKDIHAGKKGSSKTGEKTKRDWSDREVKE